MVDIKQLPHWYKPSALTREFEVLENLRLVVVEAAYAYAAEHETFLSQLDDDNVSQAVWYLTVFARNDAEVNLDDAEQPYFNCARIFASVEVDGSASH